MRILIVRLGSLGDIIHSLPAVALLRRELPDAHLGWVVEERWAELLESRSGSIVRGAPRTAAKPLVDIVHTVDTQSWRRHLFARSTISALADLRRALRAEHYDIAIDLQSALKSALVARFAGVPVRYGFTRPIEAPAGLFYTRRVPAQGRHIAEQNASLVAGALNTSRVDTGDPARVASPGAPPLSRAPGGLTDSPGAPPLSRPVLAGQGGLTDGGNDFPWVPHPGRFCQGGRTDFPLPLDPHHESWADSLVRETGTFALLSPGAGWGAKCWPAERFGEVARALAQHGITSIVNHGPGEEELAQSVVRAAGGRTRSLACTVGELIALTRRARLCIGGDTGPTHLAAALGIPVVALYGPTDPARNGPIGSRAIVLRHPESTTSHARRAAPDAGLLAISSAEVIAAARQLLAEVR